MQRALHSLLFLLLSISGIGQQILILEKGTPKNRQRYFQGSQIHVTSTKGEFQGQIIKIDSSHFLVGETKILLSEVKGLRFERRVVSILSNVALLAGAGYVTLDITNAALNKIEPVIDQSVAVTGGVLVAFGLVLWPFRFYEIPINEKNKLFILNTSLN